MPVSEQLSQALKAAFQIECHERMALAADIVERIDVLNSEDLDRIHQEFDTLYGAARAMHVQQLERLFRAITCFARFLRNNPDSQADARRHDLLKYGIEIGLQCCDAMGADAHHGARNAGQWLSEIKAILGEKYDT